MHICLLKNYNPAYPDASNYEIVRLLDEISKRGHTSSVLSLPISLTLTNEVYQSYYAGGTLHLDTPPQINETVGVTLPSFPGYVTTKTSSNLPDIVILRNSVAPNVRIGYSLLFNNLKEAGTTVVNEIDQHTKMGSKAEVYRVLQEAGVPIPKTTIIPYYKIIKQDGALPQLEEEDIEKIGDEVGYPCVIKLPYGYEGDQVDIALSAENLSETLNGLLEANRYKPVPEIIFQEYVPDSFHTYSAHIVGDFINADIRMGNPGNPDSFKASCMPGNMRFQYEVDSELESITKAALAAINLDFARFDFVRKDGQYLVLEANVSGTFTRTENCNRRNIAGALVDHAIAVHNKRKI